MHITPLLLCALLLIAAPRALAETCTCSAETFGWTGVATTDPAASWDGCAPSTDDAFVLGSGCSVEIRAGDVVDLGIGSGSIQVTNGGRLEMQAGGELVLPDGDLQLTGTAELALQGRAVSTSGSVDQVGLGPSTRVELGEYIPCPGDDDAGGRPFEDCAGAAAHPGSPAEAALCWPDERFSEAAWVGALQVGDVLVFWDYAAPWTPSRDVNAHYEIVSTRWAATSSRCVAVDLHQGSEDLVWISGPGRGYPLAYREIAPVTMRGLQPAEDRLLEVYETGINDSDAGGRTPDFNARWLSCRGESGFCFDSPGSSCEEDADCSTTCIRSLTQHAMVSETVDDPNGDLLRTLPGGLELALADAETCYLDYGWHPEDTLVAYRPARVSAPPTRNGVRIESTSAAAVIDSDFALLDELEDVVLRGASITLDFTWFQDSQGGNSALILRDPTTSRGLQFTGGEAGCGSYSCYHSVIFDPQFPNGMDGTTVEDCNMRHSGDDYLVFAGTHASSDIAARRCRFSFSDGRGGSNNLLDQSPSFVGQRDFLIDGFLAEDGGTEGNAPPFEAHGPGRLTVKNGAMVSQFGAPLCSNKGDSPWALRNIYDIGHRIGSSGVSFLMAAEGGIRETTFRDTVFLDALGSRFTTTTGNTDIDRVLVVDPRLQVFAAFLHPGDLEFDLHWSDVAIVNAQTTNTTFADRSVVHTDGNAGETESMTMERWTVVYPPGATTNFREGIHLSGDNTTYDTLRSYDGFLIAGLYGIGGTTGAVGGAGGDYNALSGLCLYENEVDAEQAGLPLDTIQGVPLEFESEADGDYRLEPDSPGFGVCGARNVGVRADNWGLRVLHYDAYAHGDAWRSPGWPGGGTRCGDLDSDEVLDPSDLAAYRQALTDPLGFAPDAAIRCDLIDELRALGFEPDPDVLADGCSIVDAAVLARRIAFEPTPDPDACAAVSQHPCCAEHSGTGCGYPETVDCVCAIDPRCCTEEWDESCAALACAGSCQDSCGDGVLGPTEECESDPDCDASEVCSGCTCGL